jgi:hypothetical protein
MATAQKLPTLVQDETMHSDSAQREPVHHYNAQAFVLSADLQQPLREVITPRAHVTLTKDGHYHFEHAEPFRFKGIISYRSGYTQVAGHHSTRKGHGFTTLATAVVEDLNILDVVTADRVVGQISTEHPLFDEGPVPAVTFLGTRFDNLRIGGHEVKIKRCLDIIGHRRDANTSYFDDQEVISRVASQYSGLQKHLDEISTKKDSELHKDTAAWATARYAKSRPAVQDLKGKDSRKIECSVVESISDAPGITFGHVIDLPHFGKIFLGELTVHYEKAPKAAKPEDQEHDKYTFELRMIRLEMGCLAKGTTTVAALDSNGKGKGGGG